ncbi:carboxylating nicotinate-nucleotide diphosphorylase [Marinicauda salina]|uniref:Probable nicotinate-nucleotide pyrophosphorylase [carboxylating] n=1 Tax=Marinicauda salina TaxID=2135793 RepID=A0A2U2BUF1_9PROT|nr:carboxylating nicotinate-nucleotide diphosphorylase [Marinicauda salina]PWE17617.1 carboxylating nicotinate-nucleotide diphosphorylase [Marinicauda salina]
MTPPLPTGLVADMVARALAEDLGGRGDVTSIATIPADARGSFVIASREEGVLAGVQAAAEAFRQVDPDIAVEWKLGDGQELHAGVTVATIEGPARGILTAERTALNFLGRMSGIATLTRAYAAAIAGTGAVIAHTRKTTPGLRALELQAVRAGGGAAHRFGLDDAVLIKDNHVAVCGGVAQAVERARRHVGHMTKIAVEIDRLDQLEAALSAGAESVLLDNFPLDDLREAVRAARGRTVLEVSGGVGLDTVRAIAETGVDVISVGAITHSAPNFDLGLDAV